MWRDIEWFADASGQTVRLGDLVRAYGSTYRVGRIAEHAGTVEIHLRDGPASLTCQPRAVARVPRD